MAALAILAALDPSHAARLALAAGAIAGATAIATLQSQRAWRRALRAESRRAEGAAVPIMTARLEAARYHGALEALPDPVLIVSAIEPDDVVGRRVVFANAEARRLLRIQGEGALFVTALRDPAVLEIVDESLFGGLERTVAWEPPGAQDRFWLATSRPLSPRETPTGPERFALLHLRDETAARSVEKMRADFLANASHELRTPLASLTGFIETLRGHARDDVAARTRFLDIMAAQAERMSRLIADLLSLSRIELNEHVPPSGEADLSLVVMDVVDGLTPLARAKGVVLAPQLPPRGAAVVRGDRDQIVQVVQNLADNAIKYSPEGAAVEIEVLPRITAAAALEARDAAAARLSLLTPDRADDQVYALVRVSDQGPGIGRQHLPRLTERFYRVEGQKSGDKLGTGLGLAIVKHIANRHRGGLAVESLAGKGATFSVYFPQGATAANRPPADVQTRMVTRPA